MSALRCDFEEAGRKKIDALKVEVMAGPNTQHNKTESAFAIAEWTECGRLVYL